jgi:APA family basic amino acid/polyamine antiporter
MATEALSAPATRHLHRVLGLAFGLAIGVGSMIGSGILRTPGAVAERLPDAGLLMLLWLMGGVHALLGANVLAELMTSMPRAGGIYLPSRRAFGEFGGVLVGWTDFLSNVAGVAALAIASAEFLGILWPLARDNTTPVAVALLLLFVGLNWLGIREGSAAQQVGSLLKFVLLCLLIGAILILVPAAPAAPAAPTAAVAPMAVLVGYQLVYGAFSGWHNPVYFAEEDKEPARNLPRALLISIALVTATYLAMNAALLHALPVATLAQSTVPVETVVTRLAGPAGTLVVGVLGSVIVLSCLNALVMAAPRVLYGLGRDRLFLHGATQVNGGGSPTVALAITTIVAAGLILTGGFETVFLLMGSFTIFVFVMTDASLFVLRRREPELPRPYRARLFPWLPALVLLLDVALLALFIAADPRSGMVMAVLVSAAMPIAWLLRRNRAAAAD